MIFILFLIVASIVQISSQNEAKYHDIKSIPVPQGFQRISAEKNSFHEYLLNLPLKTENNVVYLYNGQPKARQDVHFAVIDMEIGTKDLQQCADAVMRLRAEYFYSLKQFDSIKFNFLSDGKPRYYTDYANGDFSYKKFRKYMDYIFNYANTQSLHDELIPVKNTNDIRAGDVFIQTGAPYGHAVIVMDIATDSISGKKVFLLAQSYMPAQEIHILINPDDRQISPWYEAGFTRALHTPEWNFTDEDMHRFK
ncbi:MAG: DUF4846 domain-containing protein [Bacteroidia bacterium]|nr:DUF4846 domain-containing protein [Bacteroidia bacterium]